MLFKMLKSVFKHTYQTRPKSILEYIYFFGKLEYQ